MLLSTQSQRVTLLCSCCLLGALPPFLVLAAIHPLRKRLLRLSRELLGPRSVKSNSRNIRSDSLNRAGSPLPLCVVNPAEECM